MLKKILPALLMVAIALPAYASDKNNPCGERCKRIVDVAINNCKNAPKGVKKEFLYSLLAQEVALGVPDEYRGMVLAAACRESGYRAVPRPGDGGNAVGLLQMWPWWERFGIDRRDPISATNGWLTRILMNVKRARRMCGKKMQYRAAWAWVASGPKGWRCRSPRHYWLMKRWHRKVKWPSQ